MKHNSHIIFKKAGCTLEIKTKYDNFNKSMSCEVRFNNIHSDHLSKNHKKAILTGIGFSETEINTILLAIKIMSFSPKIINRNLN